MPTLHISNVCLCVSVCVNVNVCVCVSVCVCVWGKRQLAKRHGAPLELSCANVCIITFQFKLLYLPLALCCCKSVRGVIGMDGGREGGR